MTLWDALTASDPAEAAELQALLSAKVEIIPLGSAPEFVAGVDAAFEGGEIFAAATLYEYPGMTPVEDAFYQGETKFPYIPGLFAFREGPALVEALKRLKNRPDVILIDGQGIAHPRGIGIASHIGLLMDLPSIGCAKTRLFGECSPPGPEKGSITYMLHPEDKRPIGAVVRTKRGIRPLYVSPGHVTDIRSAVEVVLRCATGFRIPEPLRRADILSRRSKKAARASFAKTLRR